MEYTTEIGIGLKRNPKESLSSALSKLTKPIQFPKKLGHVVVKPSIYDPHLVGNTNPKVVEAVIHSFKSLGHVYIVESDNPLRMVSSAFSESGYSELIEDNVELVNLTDQETIRIEMPGHYFKEREMPILLQPGCFLINIPTMKLEPTISTLGAGIKNLFGLIPEVNKQRYHERIDDVLIDLLTIFPPNLTVVDLTQIVVGAREDGITREANAILVGTDPVAIDSFCTDLMGLDPLDIPYLKSAYELGLGEILMDRIRILGTAEQKTKLYQLCQF